MAGPRRSTPGPTCKVWRHACLQLVAQPLLTHPRMLCPVSPPSLHLRLTVNQSPIPCACVRPSTGLERPSPVPVCAHPLDLSAHPPCLCAPIPCLCAPTPLSVCDHPPVSVRPPLCLCAPIPLSVCAHPPVCVRPSPCLCAPIPLSVCAHPPVLRQEVELEHKLRHLRHQLADARNGQCLHPHLPHAFSPCHHALSPRVLTLPCALTPPSGCTQRSVPSPSSAPCLLTLPPRVIPPCPHPAMRANPSPSCAIYAAQCLAEACAQGAREEGSSAIAVLHRQLARALRAAAEREREKEEAMQCVDGELARLQGQADAATQREDLAAALIDRLLAEKEAFRGALHAAQEGAHGSMVASRGRVEQECSRLQAAKGEGGDVWEGKSVQQVPGGVVGRDILQCRKSQAPHPDDTGHGRGGGGAGGAEEARCGCDDRGGAGGAHGGQAAAGAGWSRGAGGAEVQTGSREWREGGACDGAFDRGAWLSAVEGEEPEGPPEHWRESGGSEQCAAHADCACGVEEQCGGEYESTFTLPVPRQGAWSRAKEAAAQYYAGSACEEGEQEQRERQLEEVLAENARLEEQLRGLLPAALCERGSSQAAKGADGYESMVEAGGEQRVPVVATVSTSSSGRAGMCRRSRSRGRMHGGSEASGEEEEWPAVGLKELQARRDALLIAMHGLRERAALAAEMGLRAAAVMGRKGKDKRGEMREMLAAVEGEADNACVLIKRTERVVAQMAALERWGKVLERKLESKRLQLVHLENKFHLAPKPAGVKNPGAAPSPSGTANPKSFDTANPAAGARTDASAGGVCAARGSDVARNERKERRERIESLGWLTESALMPKKQRVIEGVSAGSLVSLRAELYKSQEDAKRAKEEGGAEPRVRRAGAGAEGGPGDLFGGRNAGVEERAHRWGWRVLWSPDPPFPTLPLVSHPFPSFAPSQRRTAAKGAERRGNLPSLPSPLPDATSDIYAPTLPASSLADPLSPSPRTRDALQWKAERDVAGHLERKAAIYARLARGERAEGEGADWAGVEEKYSVDFLRRGTLEEERQEMERERLGEAALLLGGPEGDGGDGGRDGGGAAGVVAGGGMASTQRELIREVIEETRTARERAALLKAKRQQQAEQKREKLRAAFLKQQLLKEKAKKKDSKQAGGKNGGGEGGHA
ncbi:unnamed protein product [Closterium sp. Naga37s-1]|nr:unnamed protein product [Closterium sp. Naga37s-1]